MYTMTQEGLEEIKKKIDQNRASFAESSHKALKNAQQVISEGKKKVNTKKEVDISQLYTHRCLYAVSL